MRPRPRGLTLPPRHARRPRRRGEYERRFGRALIALQGRADPRSVSGDSTVPIATTSIAMCYRIRARRKSRPLIDARLEIIPGRHGPSSTTPSAAAD
jgi:hypothetical protein